MNRGIYPLLSLTLLGLAACSGPDDGVDDGSQTVTGGTTGTPSGGATGVGGQSNDGSGSGGFTPGVGGTANSGGPVGSGGNDGGGGEDPGDDTGTGGEPNGSGGTQGGDDSIEFECNLPELAAAPAASSDALKILNWAGKQAAISYTLDDGNSSQISNYTALNNLGVPFTFYLVTSWAGGSNNIWTQAAKDGHELGNHSHTHPSTANGSDIDQASQLIEQRFGVKPLTMAAPNGDQSYVSPAQSRFLFNRGVSGGSIAPNGNVNNHNLPGYIPPTGANKGTLDSGVQSAVNSGNWQIVILHGFTGDGSAYQPVSLDGFTQHVAGQRDSGKVWIDSLLNVGAYFLGQKALKAASPQNQNGQSTYSWTLPNHFPKGRCLRVQSSGTVYQKGKPVKKHAQGFYEISLDELSLSVSSN